MLPQVSSAADGPVTHGQTYVSSEEIWITIRSSIFSHIRFTCIHVCTGMQSCVKIHCHGTDFKPFMPALLSNFLEHRHAICAIGATINSWFLVSGRLATVEHSKQVLSTPKDCCLKDLWWVGFNTYMSWPWETRLCGSSEIWIDRIDVDIFVLLLASFLAGKTPKTWISVPSLHEAFSGDFQKKPTKTDGPMWNWRSFETSKKFTPRKTNMSPENQFPIEKICQLSLFREQNSFVFGSFAALFMAPSAGDLRKRRKPWSFWSSRGAKMALPALQVTEEKETNENAANVCSFFLIPTFNTENKTPKHSENCLRSWRWKRPICLELEESLMKKMFHPHRILKRLIPPKRVSTRNILHLIFAGNLLPKSVELCALFQRFELCQKADLWRT